MDSVIQLIKKHLIIKNKDILVIFGVIILYRLTFSVFNYSILRFLAHTIGHQFLFIGAAMAISNGIALTIDIPLGIAQKYIAPRYFILLAVSLLLISDTIFLMSVSSYWLAFLAILFYQLSIEVFFVTIVTYILRLSTKNDSAQNMAQSDIVANAGAMIGIALGGVLLTADKFINAKDTLVILFIMCATILLLLFVYEFADNKHHTETEKYILNLKLSQKIIGGASMISDKLITSEPTEKILENSTQTDVVKAKIDFRDIGKKIAEAMKNMIKVLIALIKDPLHAPVLFWVMIIIIITEFWNNSISFFEPFLTKSIYNAEESIITGSISRYLFESGMLLAAVFVPTFILEYPLSRLADKWGKDKVIILCTICAGIGLTVLSLFSKTLTLFIIFVVLGGAYAGIFPSMVSLLSEEYEKVNNNTPKEVPPEDPTVLAKKEESEGSEGISAALVSILMNCGQISAGLIGGAILSILDFQTIFLLLGILLLIVGAGSWFFIGFFKPSKVESPVAQEVQA